MASQFYVKIDRYVIKITKIPQLFSTLSKLSEMKSSNLFKIVSCVLATEFKLPCIKQKIKLHSKLWHKSSFSSSLWLLYDFVLDSFGYTFFSNEKILFELYLILNNSKPLQGNFKQKMMIFVYRYKTWFLRFKIDLIF